MDSLILVRLDSKYCNYLRQFDNKVPYPNIAKRCCNFKLLEEKCIEYNNK